MSLIFKLHVSTKNTVITCITRSETYGQYRPILANTDTYNSQDETNKVILEMEVFAKHIFSGIYSTWSPVSIPIYWPTDDTAFQTYIYRALISVRLWIYAGTYTERSHQYQPSTGNKNYNWRATESCTPTCTSAFIIIQMS